MLVDCGWLVCLFGGQFKIQGVAWLLVCCILHVCLGCWVIDLIRLVMGLVVVWVYLFVVLLVVVCLADFNSVVNLLLCSVTWLFDLLLCLFVCIVVVYLIYKFVGGLLWCLLCCVCGEFVGCWFCYLNIYCCFDNWMLCLDIFGVCWSLCDWWVVGYFEFVLENQFGCGVVWLLCLDFVVLCISLIWLFKGGICI